MVGDVLVLVVELVAALRLTATLWSGVPPLRKRRFVDAMYTWLLVVSEVRFFLFFFLSE